jgi:hypothetical protein
MFKKIWRKRLMDFQEVKSNLEIIKQDIAILNKLNGRKKYALPSESENIKNQMKEKYESILGKSRLIKEKITAVESPPKKQEKIIETTPKIPEQKIEEIPKENIKDMGIAGRAFFNFANKRIDKLNDLKQDLLSANIPILVQNYFSMILFFTIVSFFVGLALGALLIMTGRNILALLVFFGTPIATFMVLYTYPSMEKGSIEKKINEELPFATIYMSAIASADLEPIRIFRLIANSKEYPTLRIEINKVLKYVDIYGYNLAGALINVAKTTSNEKLAELFSGIATNTTSGGSLKNYLEKKSDNLLTDFKLERQKYNAAAGTFLDVYISLLITAPLILMIIFAIMNMTGFDIGIGMDMLNILVIFLISFLNVIFLFMLQIKQPKN